MKERSERYFKKRKDLRSWFAANYRTAESFYMVFYKRHTDRECIDYDDALEEALCFGWIDSILKRKDEDVYLRMFSRRNPKSTWSPRNVKTMRRLIEANLVKSEIVEDFHAAERNGRFAKKNDMLPRTEMPDAIKARLSRNEKAREMFGKLYAREQQAFILFIAEAKKEETRQKRLEEMVRKLEQGWRLPYHRPS